MAFVLWSPDDSYVVATAGNAAYVWNAETGDLHATCAGGHVHHITAAAWWPDGSRLVTCGLDKAALAWTLDGERAGGWASDLPASLKCRRGPVLCSTGWRSERAYRRAFARSPLKKKGTRSLLLRCSSSKSTRRPPKSPIHSRESRKRGGAGSSRPEPADPQRGRASLT